MAERREDPCPPWCVTGSRHNAVRRGHGRGDFWHEGPETAVPTRDVGYNANPIELRVHLAQREQVDERGHHRHPISVVAQQSMSPAQARELASVLLRLASEAEQAEG